MCCTFSDIPRDVIINLISISSLTLSIFRYIIEMQNIKYREAVFLPVIQLQSSTFSFSCNTNGMPFS